MSALRECAERSRLAKLLGQALKASIRAKREHEDAQALGVDLASFLETLRITEQARVSATAAYREHRREHGC
jgi:hypothetical protein